MPLVKESQSDIQQKLGEILQQFSKKNDEIEDMGLKMKEKKIEVL